MTHSGHWLRTAAMVLMPVSALSKYSYEPIRCGLVHFGANMQRREFMSLVGGAVVAWPLSARAQQLAAPAVNIAILTDMSGLFATLAGDGSVVAAYMAVEDFGGEVLGKKIRVLFGDHKHKVDIASDLANRWFNEDHVGAIVDMPNSTVALAIQKLAAERDRIAITVSAGSSDLTGKDCTQTGFHWAYDTYSNTVGMARALVGFGLDTWYFITADYAFGWSLEENASSAVKAAGGKVIGRSRHPLDTSNFSEFLTAAQDSGAKIIALANAGGDTINAVKQAAESGISPRSQTLVPLLVFISDVHSLGLDVAKGMTFVDGFYWDADSQTREWSKRFYARRGAMPTMAHAGVYSAVRHYLRAVQASGTDNAKAVAAKMRQVHVDDFFAKGGALRVDGRLVHDMYLVQVKPPEESRQPWDYYKVLSIIPGDKAFRPLAEGQCILART
jgi:branched-chain amino acid transport system substrate-binding protein